MADYSFLAGLGNGLSELGTQLSRRQLEKQAKEERDLERQRQKERDALDKQMNVLRERQTLEGMNYDANAPEPVAPNAINGMGGQEDAMKKLLATHTGDQYISGIDGTRYTRAEGQRPNELKQAHEQAMAALKISAQKSIKDAEDERDRWKATMFEGGRNTRAQGAQEGALQRIQISVDGQRANNQNSVGGADNRAMNAITAAEERQRAAYIEQRTRPTYDTFGNPKPVMTVPEAVAEWEQLKGIAPPQAAGVPSVGPRGLMGPQNPKLAPLSASDLAAAKADPAFRQHLESLGYRIP